MVTDSKLRAGFPPKREIFLRKFHIFAKIYVFSKISHFFSKFRFDLFREKMRNFHLTNKNCPIFSWKFSCAGNPGHERLPPITRIFRLFFIYLSYKQNLNLFATYVNVFKFNLILLSSLTQTQICTR